MADRGVPQENGNASQSPSRRSAAGPRPGPVYSLYPAPTPGQRPNLASPLLPSLPPTTPKSHSRKFLQAKLAKMGPKLSLQTQGLDSSSEKSDFSEISTPSGTVEFDSADAKKPTPTTPSKWSRSAKPSSPLTPKTPQTPTTLLMTSPRNPFRNRVRLPGGTSVPQFFNAGSNTNASLLEEDNEYIDPDIPLGPQKYLFGLTHKPEGVELFDHMENHVDLRWRLLAKHTKGQWKKQPFRFMHLPLKIQKIILGFALQVNGIITPYRFDKDDCEIESFVYSSTPDNMEALREGTDSELAHGSVSQSAFSDSDSDSDSDFDSDAGSTSIVSTVRPNSSTCRVANGDCAPTPHCPFPNLALLKVSHRFSAEASEVLFRINAFSFRTGRELYWFLASIGKTNRSFLGRVVLEDYMAEGGEPVTDRIPWVTREDLRESMNVRGGDTMEEIEEDEDEEDDGEDEEEDGDEDEEEKEN